jgi:hypothetical protein
LPFFAALRDEVFAFFTTFFVVRFAAFFAFFTCFFLVAMVSSGKWSRVQLSVSYRFSSGAM